MKINSFEVTGLLGRSKTLSLSLNSDINIITGRNGSGKTSLLKLLWYVLSGNIGLALREVEFRKATLETTAYTCTIYKITDSRCRIDWKDENGNQIFEDAADDDGDVIFHAEEDANALLINCGSSVFLPTFRRIEGGFTIGERGFGLNALSRMKDDIEDSLVGLSRRLSHKKHVFVSALSTIDIVSLLVRKYADLSEEYNRIQENTSKGVISQIKVFESKSDADETNAEALQLLNTIRHEIEGMEKKREEIMTPMEQLKQTVTRLFRHSGIKFGQKLNFGDAATAVSSELLSAGEKQMLSFIAYNAFYRDSVIIIDEPELSLHVDWQRQLFPILQKQHATNQFIIATHSPFIYSKYPDKEVQIDANRGDEEC